MLFRKTKNTQAAQDRLQQWIKKQAASLKKAKDKSESYKQQLEYLCYKSELFNQQNDWNSLFSLLFETFRELFPKSEIIVSDLRGEKIIPVSFTSLFYWEEIRNQCLQSPKDRISGKKDIFIKKWTDKPDLSSFFPKELKKFPGYLEIYLISSGNVYGIVQMFIPSSMNRQYHEQLLLLNTLKIQAAAALEKISHFQASQSGTRIKDELEIARDIQEHFIPVEPQIEGFLIKGYCEPAFKVGGDYLDYFQNKFGDWIIILADVSGKGIPAALIMTTLRSNFRNEGKNTRSSKELLHNVNELTFPDLRQSYRFITGFCLIIDRKGKNINYSHAGHPMLVTSSTSDKIPRGTTITGIAMGLVTGKEFRDNTQEVTISVSKGDKFLVYSDGVTETMSDQEKLYGTKRLLSLLKQNITLNPAELIRSIRTSLNSFANGRRQFDDITMMALEKK